TPATASSRPYPRWYRTTTIQVQGSHLSPQLSKSKTTTSRNRSPTGQSPVSKTRKPSHIPDPSTSPKSKTWRGRVAKQFRKFNQGANSPNSPTAPEGSTFGIPIEDCLPSSGNIHVPRFVEVCTDIIDERGLQTVGIYRVPGNNASITGLTEEVNRCYDDMPLDDPRWNDLHVVSSVLKSYFRKMPNSLVTVQLYPSFIKADKIEDPKGRMEELKRLVRSLPKHNYHTLKHIIMHLKRVADNSQKIDRWGNWSSSASNVNQNARLSMKPADLHLLTKTHSASNVFTRTVNPDNCRNSLSSVDGNAFSVQYNNKASGAGSDMSDSSYLYVSSNSTKHFADVSDTNKTANASVRGAFNRGGYNDVTDGVSERGGTLSVA
ncbi:hypothetical protein NQ318_010351, partial [Aromia moschata]